MKIEAFRKRFLNWAEPKGLDVPTDHTTLGIWVEDYILETGDTDGAREYLQHETPQTHNFNEE